MTATRDEVPAPVRREVRPRVGLVSFGLAAYWPQFPGLLENLTGYATRIADRLVELGADVVDGGFVSDAEEGAAVGERLRAAGVDLLVVNLSTYATSTQVLPVVQRCGAPALVVDLQPHARMDHPRTDTGRWLEYCGSCSLPEMSAALTRSGIPFRSVSGWLEHEPAWRRIGEWIRAATVATTFRTARVGMLGHLYPGMLDISTDLTQVHAQLGAHVEVLEIDDLRVRVEAATDDAVAGVLDRTAKVFDLDASVGEDDLAWAARVAVGIDGLVRDFRLDALAYYHRGLGGELHERLGAAFILGSSLLTGAGVPCAGEYDVRTALAMLALDRLEAGGSFTEIQACNFDDGVVEMGHDGPAHLAISDARPILRGLGLYHGKRGHGVSVEFSVRSGPVTLLGLTQGADGRYRMLVAEGETVPGPTLEIGNTTSRVDFGCDPGEWIDAWCAGGPAHHWALGTGHQASVLQKVGELTGIDTSVVRP